MRKQSVDMRSKRDCSATHYLDTYVNKNTGTVVEYAINRLHSSKPIKSENIHKSLCDYLACTRLIASQAMDKIFVSVCENDEFNVSMTHRYLDLLAIGFKFPPPMYDDNLWSQGQ